LKKNDALPEPIITPTTKATGGAHDERLTRGEILERGIVEKSLWEHVEKTALKIFKRGQEIAGKAGLILVDTKYEFGLINGQLTLVDEVHTPDSSRFWIADSYGSDEEPQNFDKEFLRLWFVEHGYRGEGVIPDMPPEFIASAAERYISAFERLTDLDFIPGDEPAADRIIQTLEDYHTTA
jgi:phosphoribosylaminoimidazole-succinocarboxamide synthase